jgi:AcrR family transcriptional regulator
METDRSVSQASRGSTTISDHDPPASPQPGQSPGPRERTLGAAYDLFRRHGAHSIGIDRIVAVAGVAKMTLYRYFRSKDELVIATLERREEAWTTNWLIREIEARAGTPAEQLIAVFDVFDEWFRREDYEGCFFINTLLESHDHTSAVGGRAALGLDNVCEFVRRLADEAGVGDAKTFARRWHVLMSGAIVLASSGYRDAALRAKEAGRILLDQELGATSRGESRSSR